MTAGNSTPLTDGASAVLLASEEWARSRGLPVLAYLTYGKIAAVDFVEGRRAADGARLRGAADARSDAGSTLQDFDFYEIHEAFAAAGAVHAEGLGVGGVLPRAARLDAARSARSTARSSTSTARRLAVGHPFAATGGTDRRHAREAARRARRRAAG